MQRDRCYDDLICALLLETRQSQPAVSVRFEWFRDLHDTLLPVDSGNLFFVSAEPQAPRDCPCGRQSCVDHIVSIGDEMQELDLSKLLGNLNEYFSWFGTVQVIYLLGTSVAVFKMEHTFSVSHVLKCSLHEISIPKDNRSIAEGARGPPRSSILFQGRTFLPYSQCMHSTATRCHSTRYFRYSSTWTRRQWLWFVGLIG